MVDGQMAIAEGETEYRLTLPDPLLYLFSEKEERTQFFDLKKHAFPWHGRQALESANDGEPAVLPINITAYYPKARRHEEILPAETGEAAVKFRLHNNFVDQEGWLIRNSPESSEIQMGPARLRFAEALVAEKPVEHSDGKANYLEFQFQNKTIQLPIQSGLKTPVSFALEGTPYKINILHLFRNAVVVGKELVEQEDKTPGSGQNPAIQFVLQGSGIEERHTAFSKFPDFPTVHGLKPSAAGARVFYRTPSENATGSSGKRHDIIFVVLPKNVILRPKAEESKDEILHGVYPRGSQILRFAQNDTSRRVQDDKRGAQNDKLVIQIIEGSKVTTYDVEKGKEIATGWMGNLTVTAEEFYPHAAVKRTFTPESNMSESEEAVPAIQVEIMSSPNALIGDPVDSRFRGNDKKTLWLRQGVREEISAGNSKYYLMVGQKKIPAGFKLMLRDFRMEQYPGTDRPASFESDVTLKDDSRGLVKDVTISMNKPLAYRGYHIYQSGYSLAEGAPETSIFSVGKDAGVPLKYFGTMVMVIGIITMFYTRRFSTSSGSVL